MLARSGKCRVLVSGGVAVAEHPPASKPESGVRLEVGCPVWTEIAKQPAPHWPTLAEDHSEYIDPLPAVADPRDVRLSRPTDVLWWALQFSPWRPGDRKVLSALYDAAGDTQAVSKTLGIDEDRVIRLKNRARAEVLFAAREMDWQDNFAREHRELLPFPKWIHRPMARSRVWFRKNDYLCYLFDIDRRVEPYAV